MSKVSITKSKMDNLANAVAAKSGIPVLLSVDEMTDAVLGISVGEENVLEGVKVNGIELSITNKKVNIPVVSQNQAGVITQGIIDTIYNDFNISMARKLNISELNIGYVSANRIYIPGGVWYRPDGHFLSSSGKFYFIVYPENNDIDIINKSVNYASPLKYLNTAYQINLATFSKSGLYVGYISNQTLQYTRVADLSDLPTKVSDLTNDSGFITTETDPTVPAWAKTQNKPTYTFSELTTHPTTINGYGITDAKIENGVITLGNNTITPLPSSTKAVDIDGVPTRSYKALATYDVEAQIENKNGVIILNSWQDNGAGYLTPNYNGLVHISRVGVLLGRYTSGDFSAPSYSIQVRSSGVTINNLVTPTADADAANKKYVDDSIGALSIPTKTSDLTNDSGYLTSYTETDPVYSASAAADITSTDITNWNSKTSNTGTVTSVGLSNATNGGLTISGSPITTNGSITVGHTNVLSAAQTTQAVYPIKIDKNGHISAYGTAVTSMPASDVYEWAKAATKPTYTYSEVGAAPSSHAHGNITSGGDITAAAPTIASGDQLIINDNSESKVTNGPTFDGSTTTKALTPKGTWETFVNTESDPTVPSWAKASSKPSYTFSELTSHPTSISGYGITDAYTKTEVDNKVSAVLKYKGVKATIGDLPSTGNVTGDTWHVTATSGEYAWDGTEWQELGTAISIPSATGSATTGISVAAHSTDSIYGVSSSTTSVYGVSTSTTTASKVTVGNSSTDYGVTAAGSGNASLTFTMDTTDTKKLKISFTHTHTAPTLGSKVPTVSASDVTVPIKNADATTVPIKNAGATTVVTSATHSVTDTGHTHTI